MFDISNFQVNRGTYNSQAAGGDKVSIGHSYKSALDTIAEITTAGYFPANFGQKNGIIQAQDTLKIVTSAGIAETEITDPLTPTIIVPAVAGGVTTAEIHSPNPLVGIIIGGVGETPPVFPSGLTFSAGAESGTLGEFDDSSQSISFSGPWASPIIANVHVQKFNTLVLMTITAIVPAAATVGTVITGTMLPAQDFAFPETSVSTACPIVNNSVAANSGLITISDTGVITIAATLAGGNFTALGNAGTLNIQFVYSR